MKQEGEWDVEQKGSSLVISEEDFPSKERESSSEQKKLKMHIQVPGGQAFQIAVVSGQAEINGLQIKNLSISMLGHGTIKTTKTKGDLQIFQGFGQISVKSHIGSLALQAEDSVVNVQSSRGSIELRSLKGQIKVSNSSGELYVRSFKAPTVLKTVSGKLDFLLEKGGLYLQNLTGSIKGYSKEGEVRGVVRPENVDIETGEGRIHLNFPHSMAWVKVESWDGKVRTPVYFRRIKTGGMDRASGRLKGKKYRGNVSLKSRSGSITVYQSHL